MLAISPLRGSNRSSDQADHHPINMEATFTIGGSTDDFPDFGGSNLLDSIDFDDLFMSMHDDHTPPDMLPDLEMDPDLLAEFSLSGEEDSNNNSSIENSNPNGNPKDDRLINNEGGYDTTKNGSVKRASSEEEIESRKVARKNPDPGPDPDSDSTTTTVNSTCMDEGEKVKKSLVNNKTRSDSNNNSSNNNQGKRKAKVDWTPELHRRFVQAVEQLGVDKAVPSRILELMGIDCLTRHNIASHLQKYRSHRKHLLAREAEAANWTQKRQVYGVAKGGGPNNNNNISPWHTPAMMCFPPMSAMHQHHPFRPLHVWGHPTMDLHSRLPIWPKPPVSSPSPPPLPPPAWTPSPAVVDPSFWNSPHHRVQNGMTQAAPCFPQPLPATRFPAPPVPVPGIPSHAIYRPDHGVIAPPHPTFDAHPSKESVDAALEDILAKPWQPLPIGLKPPSIDSVLVELQRQGVPKIPPSSST